MNSKHNIVAGACCDAVNDVSRQKDRMICNDYIALIFLCNTLLLVKLGFLKVRDEEHHLDERRSGVWQRGQNGSHLANKPRPGLLIMLKMLRHFSGEIFIL
jgi:hypothetical protein